MARRPRGDVVGGTVRLSCIMGNGCNVSVSDDLVWVCALMFDVGVSDDGLPQ